MLEPYVEILLEMEFENFSLKLNPNVPEAIAVLL